MVYFFGITTYSKIYETESLIIQLDPENMSSFWEHFNLRNLELSNMNSEHVLLEQVKN